MSTALALAPTFGKGVAVITASVILFVGSVYVLLGAFFGLRMGYLVLAVSFFGWMIIFSALWVFGAPGTPRNLGPRGTEPHWQVFAAGTADVNSRYAETLTYPGGRWQAPNSKTKSSVDTVTSVVQGYLAHQARAQLEKSGVKVCDPKAAPGGSCFNVDISAFTVQDMKFLRARGSGTSLVAAHAFYGLGGPQVTVFAYRDKGNVPVYSIAFLLASLVGFALHVPLLDKAEAKRKAILTGGTAPPWYGPA
jgi:hypothetical protein